MTIGAQRAMIWWALGFMVIFGSAWFFLIGLMPLPPATQTPAEVAAFYSANSMKIRIGATICSWTSAFMVPFYAVIAAQMARLEKGIPIWAILQFGGGMMMTIFLVLPPLFWGVAAFAPDRAPEITAIMHQLANLTLVTTDQYFIFQMVPLVVLALTTPDAPDNPLPRWFGYFSIWVAFMFELGAAGFMFKTGPFAWNGLFVFWLPLTIFGVWVSVMSWVFLRAIGNQQASAG